MSKQTLFLRPISLLVVIASLLLAACSPAAAPSGDTVKASDGPSGASAQGGLLMHLVGQLDEISGSAATVNGTRLLVDASTQLDPGLQTHQIVRAKTVPSQGGLSALEIKLAAPDDPTGFSFELTGLVESQTATAWVISGQTVLIEPATEIQGSPVVGSLVKAQGSVNDDGQMVAREIRLLDPATATAQPAGSATPRPTAQATQQPGAEREFTGVVTSIGPNQWVIGGQTVLITADTEIKGSIAVGDTVKVHARQQADGSWVAREIEPEDDGPRATGTPRPGQEIEFTGTLTAIAGDLWTIGGATVRVTSATEVEGNPQVGDMVKVHAALGTDGILVAREIEPESAGDDDHGGGDDNSGSGNGDQDNGNGDDDHGGGDDNSGSGNGDQDNGNGDDDHGGGDNHGGGDHSGGDDGGGDQGGGDDD